MYMFFILFFFWGGEYRGFSNEQYTCACTQNPKGMLLTHTLWVRYWLDPAVSILVWFIIYFILSWLLISKIADCYCPMFKERQGTPHPLGRVRMRATQWVWGIPMCQNSSVVEQETENLCVVCSIQTFGNFRIFSILFHI